MKKKLASLVVGAVAATGGLLTATAPQAQALPMCNQANWVAGTLQPTYYGSTNCVLMRGAQGQAVRALQYILTCAVGDFHPIDIDGSFGDDTKYALMVAQNMLGLQADGVYGPQSRAALPKVYGYSGTPGQGTWGVSCSYRLYR
ncbi:peptidoglycan-binding domain-containing protein [Aestuariimicrobium soli]|uniref:peptidoglycan-binding domain-containing protein n=1 Tax=Aestuariimicrobium soli TaxID=2035834 RepID=UPI003EBCB6B0